jgi:hypothetical protein
MAVALATVRAFKAKRWARIGISVFDVSSGHPLGWLMSLVCHRLPHSVPHERGGLAYGDRVGKRGDRMGTDWGPEWRTGRDDCGPDEIEMTGDSLATLIEPVSAAKKGASRLRPCGPGRA